MFTPLLPALLAFTRLFDSPVHKFLATRHPPQGISLLPTSYENQLPTGLYLLQTSIEELGLFLSNGSLTSEALVQAYLANIERDNLQGQELRAVIQTAPVNLVLDIASGLDRERSEGRNRGPLHGIPILVKDSIATDDSLGMDTSAGNFALKESKVKQDAEVIRKLREAGAIIIGKANLAEFSAWKSHPRPSLPGNGVFMGEWSSVGGQVISAYVEGRWTDGADPSGSSSGSAVGVSAGFAAGALGGDTTGSVIYPANRAALFAIRPTTGLVSTEGVVPITAEFDTIGPMGFTTRDVALMLDAMTYNDHRYINATQPVSLDSLRLGLVRNNFLDEADGRQLKPHTCVETVEDSMKSTMKMLHEQEGVSVVNVNLDVDYEHLLVAQNAANSLLTLGMREDMRKYLEGLEESPVRTLRDLVEWNEAHAAIEFKADQCCQQSLIDSLISPGRGSPEYYEAWNTVHTLGRDRGLAYLFDDHDVDALVFSPELGLPMTLVAALGYVAGTAPMGQCNNGAPFGILFVVKPGQEEKLLGILTAYEAVTPRRRTPTPMTKTQA